MGSKLLEDNNDYKIELSPYHKLFYNEWKINPNANYNIVFDQTLYGSLDILQLKFALHRFVSDHVLLNSHVNEIENNIYWVKNKKINELDYFEYFDEQQLYDYVASVFDLENSPLYRFAVYKQINGNYRFIIVMHHILIDGSSFDELILTISNYYNDPHYKVKLNLNQQHQLLVSTTEQLYLEVSVNKNKNKEFWHNYLAGSESIDLRFTNSNTLPIGPEKNINRRVGQVRFSFSKDVTSKAMYLTKYGLSVYQYGQIIFAILLHRYTSQESFAISYPVKIKANMGFIYGAGVNTNVIYYCINDNTKISDLIRSVNKFKEKISLHALCPISAILEGKDKNLLEVFFAQTNLKNTKCNFVNVETININHDFNIDLLAKLLFEQEVKDGIINYRVRYDRLKIDKSILNAFVNHYKRLFLEILKDLTCNIADKLITEYPLLDEKEYQEIIYNWNNQGKESISNKTVHQLFEEQVKKNPDKTALIYETVELTYTKLNQKANQLAHYLHQEYKLQPDDLIALCLTRNEHLLVSIIGVLKAGAGYVPIDPSFPDERLRYILKDIRAKIILTNEIYYDRLRFIFRQAEFNSIIISIDNENIKQQLSLQAKTNLELTVNNSNLAYVIYTSGTTGQPKGVMVEHKSVVTLVRDIKYVNISCLDCIPQFSTIAFDAATFEIWGALLNGARLYLPTDVLEIFSDVNKLKNLIIRYKISIMFLTKVLFDQLYIQDNTLFKNLSYLLVGGEILNYELITKLAGSKYKPKNLLNIYGPTENTTFSSAFSIDSYSLTNLKSVPIGKPIDHKSAYILDSKLNPLPIGAIGELFVGGIGIARGYLNNVGLTQEKFLPNPFQNKKEKLQHADKIYKTGDLARYLPDANIEYIRRADSQVKIRGYRIELKEIECKIANYPGVKQVVVLCNNTNNTNENKYLIAYYVSDNQLDEIDLLNYLSAHLPEYMLPKALARVDKLPFTVNGKLNVDALPQPHLILVNNFISPHNDLELQICKIFAEVLKIPEQNISINDDFFSLGGNSILAIRLVAKLQNNFSISVNDVFKFKTPARIAEFAPFVKDNLRSKLEQIKLAYSKLADDKHQDQMAVKDKYLNYLQEVRQLSFVDKLKDIHSVLLTGATGHLGCHILYQLLYETKYKVYLLVRAASNKEAYNRLSEKFLYYFDVNLDNYKNRIIVLAADLKQSKLNLNELQYKKLISNVDSIIHCAALVKHYGNYEDFFQSNIQATINLLELAKLTQFKDFHYISTIGIFMEGYIPNYNYYVFIENDNNDIMENKNRMIYTQTKYEGELITLKYREYGVNTNIYRVGNMVMNSKNYRNQNNIEENAFFQRVKTILNFGIIPKELSQVEISPVDCTALAIVKLFNQVELSNQIYHVFNPHTCDLFKLFTGCKNVNVIMTPFDKFINTILKHLDSNADTEQIELFMLHQGWLQDIDINKLTKINILENKTSAILAKLNFSWPYITSDMLMDVINQSLKRINKMIENEQIFKHLNFMAQMVSAPFYWMDLNGRFLGLNKKGLEAIGASNEADIIGKTVYEIYPNDIADKLQKDIKEIILTGKDSHLEDEIADFTTGRSRHYMATRSPLRDYEGNIIGIVGTSIEITAEKEAEQLRGKNEKLEFENQAHKIVAEEQAKFRKTVNQMVHDIGTPLASLNMLISSCTQIPEEIRVDIRECLMRISGITRNVLNQYTANEYESTKKMKEEKPEPLLLSCALMQSISEKKHQYHNQEVKFVYDFPKASDFVFVNIQPNAFKRSISNIINNAVDAFDHKAGTVTLKLDIDEKFVNVIVEDNGKGMPEEVKNKIMNNIEVTSGKAVGHGIGMGQVRDTLTNNNGEMRIDSEPGKGTIITLTFPRINAPGWIADKIHLSAEDTLLILDDDDGIHGAWDKRFSVDTPNIPIKHFTHGQEVIDYVSGLSPEQKGKLFLLTDYELLRQELNGLHVIERTGLKRSILVTSHYENEEVRKLAAKTDTKILPKLLASEIPIILKKTNEAVQEEQPANQIVVIDDDAMFLKVLTYKFLVKDYAVEGFHNPHHFLSRLAEFPKTTRICFDYDFNVPSFNGLDLAKVLHEQGYTKLYLLSGMNFKQADMPPYLILIPKDKAVDMLDMI